MSPFHPFEADIGVDEQMMEVQPGLIMQFANLDTTRLKPAQGDMSRGNLISIC